MTKMVKFYLEFYNKCSDHITYNLKAGLMEFFWLLTFKFDEAMIRYTKNAALLIKLKLFIFLQRLVFHLPQNPSQIQGFWKWEKERKFVDKDFYTRCGDATKRVWCNKLCSFTGNTWYWVVSRCWSWKSEKNPPVEVSSILSRSSLNLFSSLHYHTLNLERLLNTVDFPSYWPYYEKTKSASLVLMCQTNIFVFIDSSYLSLRFNNKFFAISFHSFAVLVKL